MNSIFTEVRSVFGDLLCTATCLGRGYAYIRSFPIFPSILSALQI